MLSDLFDASESAASPQLVPREPLPGGGVRLLLHARAADVAVHGWPARVLTYNGTLPGPLLVLQEGERAQLQFTNRLEAPTGLHLHGLPVPPLVAASPHLLEPGASTTFAFDVPRGAAGTYWYHPPVHGAALAGQLAAGLAGALLVRGPLDREEPLSLAQEHVLVLQDVSPGEGAAPGGAGGPAEGRAAHRLRLVNGLAHPVLAVRTGLLRLRLLNASPTRPLRLALPGRPLHVIGLDGAMLEAPVAHAQLELVAGGRADVLVEAREAGTLTLVDLPAPGAFGGPSALCTLLVEAPAAGLGDAPAAPPLPTALGRVEALDASRASATRAFALGTAFDVPSELPFGAPASGEEPLRLAVRGRGGAAAAADVEVRAGALEVWEFHNPGQEARAFHLPLFPFQVLARDGVEEPFRAWREGVAVRPGGTVRLAIPFPRAAEDVPLGALVPAPRPPAQPAVSSPLPAED
jgi:FtsP/CotA-like multicopper oxidase with cupredoxin domain